jgi:hypothetical protein
VVSVSNLHPQSSLKDVEAALKAALPEELKTNLKVHHSQDQGKVLQIRLKSSDNVSKIRSALAAVRASAPSLYVGLLSQSMQIKLKDKSLVVSEAFPLAHPCVFIRNIAHLTEEQLRPLVEKFHPRRINFSYRSELVLDNTMVAYFDTEHDAYSAFKSLKNISLDGHRLTVNYK